MKSFRSLFFALLAVALCATGCQESPYINGPGNNDNNQISRIIPPDPDALPDPEGVVIPDGCLNVYQAYDSCMALQSGEVSQKRYFIKGWVCQITDKTTSETISQYGNAFFYLGATMDASYSKTFYAYQCMGKLGAKLTDISQVAIGDFVIMSAFLTNYNGIAETSGANFIYSSTNETFNTNFTDFESFPLPTADTILTVSQAELIIKTLDNKATTLDVKQICGVVCSVDEAANSRYGNATFRITDGKTFLIAYRCKGLKGASFTNANQVAVGDVVIVEGNLQNYNGTAELNSGGKIISSTNPNLQ